MRRWTTSLCVIGVLVVASGTLIAWRAEEPADWKMSVLSLPMVDKSVAPLWLGFLNADRTAKLLCVMSWDMVVETPDGKEGVGKGPSPHGCDVQDSFQLVLAGETLYTAITPPSFRRIRVTPSMPTQITVSVVERSVSHQRNERTATLAWKGSLDDARAAGRLLVSHP